MNRAKAIALDALKSPVRRAINEAWANARAHAWVDIGGGRVFRPMGAVNAMRLSLNGLRHQKILDYCEIKTDESSHIAWYLDVKYTFRQNGARRTGQDRFRIW